MAQAIPWPSWYIRSAHGITTGSLGTAFVPGLIAVLVFALIVLWRIRKSEKEFASEYSLHAALIIRNIRVAGETLLFCLPLFN